MTMLATGGLMDTARNEATRITVVPKAYQNCSFHLFSFRVSLGFFKSIFFLICLVL